MYREDSSISLEAPKSVISCVGKMRVCKVTYEFMDSSEPPKTKTIGVSIFTSLGDSIPTVAKLLGWTATLAQ
jgi:hypothetical protein